MYGQRVCWPPPPRDDGWFPTGDIGFFKDGELYVRDRIKDLIITQGKNIYRQDVENAVNDPDVQSERIFVTIR
jgi:long-chain acyl-CoA synthetase